MSTKEEQRKEAEAIEKTLEQKKRVSSRLSQSSKDHEHKSDRRRRRSDAFALGDIEESPYQPRLRPITKKRRFRADAVARSQWPGHPGSRVQRRGRKESTSVHSGHRRCAALRFPRERPRSPRTSSSTRFQKEKRGEWRFLETSGGLILTAYEKAVAIRDYAKSLELSNERGRQVISE